MKSVLFTATLALLLGACASIDTRSVRTLPAGSTYVSMGSSYAAGAGIGPLREGAPERCNRTTNNYSSLLAKRLALKLIDVSCGGATSDNIIGSWNELPPQIDAVHADTRLVTVTIGGNDLGYVGWLFGSSCRLGVVAFSGPCRPSVEPVESDYRKLKQNLLKIAEQVHRRAPQARLIFIQYVALISAKPCSLEPISPADILVARRISGRLAEITKDAALQSGAEILKTDIASRGHTPCSPNPWSNGLSNNYDKTLGSPWHPNAAGHAAIADLLFTMLTGG